MSVPRNTLLNNWYGFDKKIEKPVQTFNSRDIGMSNIYHKHNFSEEVANCIRYLSSSDQRVFAVKNFVAPCDGFTDADFINWTKSTDFTPENPYRGMKYQYFIQNLTKSSPKYNRSASVLRAYYNDFFKVGTRNDELFRIIELNEFLIRGRSGQSFEDFLKTDVDYIESCRNLHVEMTPVIETLVSYSLPAFLKFSKKTNLKTKRLLLPLTKAEIENLFVNHDKNPLLGVNKENSHTYDYAVEFISSASGNQKILEITEMHMRKVIDEIVLAAMNGNENFWRSKKLGPRRSIVTLIDYLSSLNKSIKITRNLAYIISTGVLNSLDPAEITAVVCGFENPARWAVPTSRGALETVCELIDEDKVSALDMCKIIAHVNMTESALVELRDDFDWESIRGIPAEWAATAMASKRKSSLSINTALATMMK